jgi:hypothetical protein
MGKDMHHCSLTLDESKSDLNGIVKLKNRAAKDITNALIKILGRNLVR